MSENRQTLRKALAVTRKLARAVGVKPDEKIGSVFLIAGICKAIGQEHASDALRSAGVANVAELFEAIPDALPEDADRLPALRPDARLEAIMRGELSPFLAGDAPGEMALEVLLAPENVTDSVRRFLADPGYIARSRKNAKEFSTRELVRGLSDYIQLRYRLGRQYYSINAKTGHSDFARGNRDADFFSAVDDMYEAEREARQKLFGGSLYQSSPLGRYWKEYGEDAGHVLTMVLLSDMGQVGSGPLSVREIAWCLDPKYFHRMLARARAAVRQLAKENIVELAPEGNTIHLFQRVIATEPVLDDFLSFLRDQDPISDQEAQDMLKRMP